MAFADFIRNRTAIRISLLAIPLVAFLALPSVAQDPDFDWSWEKGDAAVDPAPKPDEESSADAPAKPGSDNSDFDWSWKEGDKAPVGERPTKRPPASKSDRVRDDESYQKLLKENLGLRREIAEAMKDEEVAKKESSRLAAEIKDMEKNLSESVQVIKSLKSSHDGAMSPEQINELEVRLGKADRAKEEMAAELDRLRRLRDGAEQDLKSVTAGVTPKSDLFRDKEKENALLKKRLVEIETARRKLASSSAELEDETSKARKEARKAKEELKQISGKALAIAKLGAHYKKIVETLPEINKQVSAMKRDAAKKDEKLSMRAQELAALKLELDRREHRLVKQQKMTDLLERARAEVMKLNNREKLDMHYNMAVIYAKEGRVLDAENEYLKALRLDPTDADIHYNLGILYDQDLKKTRKAAMHYRRYITLRPSSTDVDQVSSWILDLEMAN